MTQPSADHSARPGSPADLVDRLVKSIRATPHTRHLGAVWLPHHRRVDDLMLIVRELIFPGFFQQRNLDAEDLPRLVGEAIERLLPMLTEQIRACLRYHSELSEHARRPGEIDDMEAEAARIAHAALERLPALRDLLALDVQAAYDGDPAATHTDEVIFSYPGLEAVLDYRFAHELLRLGVPLLPRIICEQAHSRTGIDIHPGAQIGRSFFIDHGAGVVIGETCVIGERVKIYQGVTLGAKSFAKDERGRLVRGAKRHPTIGDRVTIYAGAVILGGDTIVGDDCVISGGVFLTQSVPARHVVRQKQPELVMRSNPEAGAG